MVAQIEDEDYQTRVRALMFSVVRKLNLQKDNLHPITMELKEKLVSIQGIERFKLIPFGKGEYHVLLSNMKDQSAVLA